MKKPRDFVFVDDFWDADKDWSSYCIANKVWVYVDEYRAGQTGDPDYSRIIVHNGQDKGLVFKRQLKEKAAVQNVLGQIRCPISETQLLDLGFVHFSGSCLLG